jgi:hypothetical protein
MAKNSKRGKHNSVSDDDAEHKTNNSKKIYVSGPSPRAAQADGCSSFTGLEKITENENPALEKR